MSRAAELAYELQIQREDEENARIIVVGTVVYRPGWADIEEGVVRRVSRCDLDLGGNVQEREGGKYPYYVAQFKYDWVGQTSQFKWFTDRAKACNDLVKTFHSRIDEKRLEIERWEKLIETFSVKKD